MEKDKEAIEEIRKICQDNGILFEETVTSMTPSMIKKDERFLYTKEVKKNGQDFFFCEISKNLTNLRKLIKEFFERKFIVSEYQSKLAQVVLCNKNKLYFVIRKSADSELLYADNIQEHFPSIDDRVKLALNLTKAVLQIREKLAMKIKEPKNVTLYGLSTEKFSYCKEYKKIEFINIGLDELTMADSDTNDKRFWSPEKFNLLFKNVDKYKLDMYSLGCVFYEIFSCHPPLEENSQAAYDTIKNKSCKLVSDECERILVEQLDEQNYSYKKELVELIDRMTTLEEKDRTIQFEEVYNALYSFLPKDHSKTKCLECLEKAEYFLKGSYKKYCNICKNFHASNNEPNFYNDSTLHIQEVIECSLPDKIREERKLIETIEQTSKLQTHIDEIQENFDVLASNKKVIKDVNNGFDDLISLLQAKKKLFNEYFENYSNVNQAFFGKTLSIFKTMQNLINNSVSVKNSELDTIKSHQAEYQKDYELIVKDLNKLEGSIKQTNEVRKLSQIFSTSFETQVNDHIRSANKGFENSLEEGMGKISYVGDLINEFDSLIKNENIERVNKLTEVASKVEALLDENSENTGACIKIADDSQYSDLIVKNEDEDEEESDSVYTKG